MSYGRLWAIDEAGLQRPEPGTSLNFDSQTAWGLRYYWPLWDGHGTLGEELIHGLHAKANTPATPSKWGASESVELLVRQTTSASVFRVSTPAVAMPVTLSCILMVDAYDLAGQNRFLCHDNAGNAGYRLSLNNIGRLLFSFPGVADYSSGIAVPANQPCVVAASATGAGGTVIWAAYNLRTGLVQTGGPTTISTPNAGPNQWSLGGLSWFANSNATTSISDVMVHSRAMTRFELVDLVTTSTRWDVFNRSDAFSVSSMAAAFSLAFQKRSSQRALLVR